MSVLFCDSNCELWHDQAKELGLQVIRMPYTIDGKEYYYDLGEATDFAGFYQQLRNKKEAKTSALNQQDYLDYFEPWFAKGEDILYLSFSHKMSATFESMDRAVEELLKKYPGRKFTCFDTRNISDGAGIQVYYAAKLKQEGKSDEEIVAFLNDFTNHVGVYFAVDDLNHLKRGGRISATSAVVGTLVGIKPILTVQDGSLVNIAKIRGRKRAIMAMFDLYRENVSDLGYDVWVVGADCDADTQLLTELVNEFAPNTTVHRQIVGPVIASHCGPDTIGIIYHSKF